VRADVAIVGAGPAGAIAAHRLAGSGVQVAFLERAAFPRDKPCGDGVSGDGLAALARTGLGEWASQFAAPEALRLTSPRHRCTRRIARLLFLFAVLYSPLTELEPSDSSKNALSAAI
jgi:flavin-dependent dehydrogenase